MKIFDWFKKHIFEIAALLAVIIIFIFFSNWAQHEPGKSFFEEAISNLPFLNFCHSSYKASCKIFNEAPDTIVPAGSSILLDVMKILTATPVIMFLHRIIFTKIPIVSPFLTGMPLGLFESNIAKEAAATGATSLSPGLKSRLMAREAEDYLDSAAYKFKTALVSTIITIVTLLFTSHVYEKFKEPIINFLSTKTGSLIGIVTIVALFAGYCVIFNYFYHGTFSFAIIKTIVFNIIPGVITPLISGVLYYCANKFITQNGNVLASFLFFLVLFIWNGIKGTIESKLRVISTAYRSYYDFRFSTFVAALCIYTSYVIAGQFNSDEIDTLLQNKFVQMFFNIKVLPFFDYIVGGVKVIDRLNINDAGFNAELIKLCYFALTVCIASVLLKNLRTELSKSGILKWFLKVSLEITIVFVIYSFLIYATNGEIHKMLIVLLVYAIAAVVLNIIAARTNSTSALSFGATNLLLEAVLIAAGTLLLIYVAESIVNENFLHMATRYSPDGSIEHIMNAGFIARMNVVTVLMIAWFVFDLMDWGVKSDS